MKKPSYNNFKTNVRYLYDYQVELYIWNAIAEMKKINLISVRKIAKKFYIHFAMLCLTLQYKYHRLKSSQKCVIIKLLALYSKFKNYRTYFEIN